MCVCVRVCSLRLCVSLCLYACVCVCLYRSRSRSPSASPLRLCLHRAQCIFRVSGTNCRQATLLARLSPSLSPPLSLYMHLTLTPPCSFSLYFLSAVGVCFAVQVRVRISCSLYCPRRPFDFVSAVPPALPPSCVTPLFFPRPFSSSFSLWRISVAYFSWHFPLGCCGTKAKAASLSSAASVCLCVCVDRTPTQAHIFSMQLFANENGKLREQIIYSRNDRRGKWGHIKTGIGGDVGVDDSLAYL